MTDLSPAGVELGLHPYAQETFPDDDDPSDDGTMPENVEELRQAVIGRRIVSVDKVHPFATVITLDDGRRVRMVDTADCCAHTELEAFLLHPERIDHAILGVGTTGGYTRWHVYADMGDVLELTVGWSDGNPFYYGYGFDIIVDDKDLR